MNAIDPRAAYRRQQLSAKERGIPFTLSFEQWWAIWEPEYSRRGRAADELGMCRTRDEGAYTVGNVRLDTPKGNAGDRVVANRVRKAPSAYLTSHQSRGGTTEASGADWCLRDPFAPYSEDESEDAS